MALVDPYCTIIEADVFLTDSAIWLAATEAEQNKALYWGRIYIDATYTCVDWTTLDTDPSYPEELKYANALTAEAYLNGDLYEVSETGDRAVTSIKVKAGDVESEKRYQGDRAFSMGSAIDQFPEITAVLENYCSKKGKNPNLITRV